eukprot:Selendium_serpulae@DN1873_c0_g1_i1.p1
MNAILRSSRSPPQFLKFAKETNFFQSLSVSQDSLPLHSRLTVGFHSTVINQLSPPICLHSILVILITPHTNSAPPEPTVTIAALRNRGAPWPHRFTRLKRTQLVTFFGRYFFSDGDDEDDDEDEDDEDEDEGVLDKWPNGLARICSEPPLRIGERHPQHDAIAATPVINRRTTSPTIRAALLTQFFTPSPILSTCTCTQIVCRVCDFHVLTNMGP